MMGDSSKKMGKKREYLVFIKLIQQMVGWHGQSQREYIPMEKFTYASQELSVNRMEKN